MAILLLVQNVVQAVQQAFRVGRFWQEVFHPCADGVGVMFRVAKTAGDDDANGRIYLP